MTLGDKVVIFLATICGVFLLFSGVYSKTQAGVYATVWFNGEKFGDFSLSKNQIIQVKNGIKLEIKNKKIRVLENTCSQKLCIHQGWVSNPGATIICIPNKLVINVVGENKKYDALSQ